MDNCDLMGFSAFAKLNGTKPKRHKTLFLFTDDRKPFCATHYRQSYRNQLLSTVVGRGLLESFLFGRGAPVCIGGAVWPCKLQGRIAQELHFLHQRISFLFIELGFYNFD